MVILDQLPCKGLMNVLANTYIILQVGKVVLYSLPFGYFAEKGVVPSPTSCKGSKTYQTITWRALRTFFAEDLSQVLTEGRFISGANLASQFTLEMNCTKLNIHIRKVFLSHLLYVIQPIRNNQSQLLQATAL